MLRGPCGRPARRRRREGRRAGRRAGTPRAAGRARPGRRPRAPARAICAAAALRDGGAVQRSPRSARPRTPGSHCELPRLLERARRAAGLDLACPSRRRAARAGGGAPTARARLSCAGRGRASVAVADGLSRRLLLLAREVAGERHHRRRLGHRPSSSPTTSVAVDQAQRQVGAVAQHGLGRVGQLGEPDRGAARASPRAHRPAGRPRRPRPATRPGPRPAAPGHPDHPRRTDRPRRPRSKRWWYQPGRA